MNKEKQREKILGLIKYMKSSSWSKEEIEDKTFQLAYLISNQNEHLTDEEIDKILESEE